MLGKDYERESYKVMKRIRLEKVDTKSEDKKEVGRIYPKQKLMNIDLVNFINCQLDPNHKARYQGLTNFMNVIDQIQPEKKKKSYESDDV